MPAEYPTDPFAVASDPFTLETIPYWASGWKSDQAALTTGKARVVPIQAAGGCKVSTVTFTSGLTPSGSLTHSWAAIIAVAPTAQTTLTMRSVSDDITTTWAASTDRTFTFRPSAAAAAKPYVFESEETEYVILIVVATTVPTLLGIKYGSVATIAPTSNGIYPTTTYTTPSSLGSVTTANITGDKILPAMVLA